MDNLNITNRKGAVMASIDRCLKVVAQVSLPEGVPMAAKSGDVGTVYIYQAIGPEEYGGLSASAFQAELDKLGKVKTLAIRINSIGGSVFDGIAIMNAITNHPAKDKIVYVDALAASAASFIAMAGTKIVMAPDAMMMIHEPHSVAAGRASELRSMADLLDKTRETLINIYARRTKLSREALSNILANETWLTASEAVTQGFADEVSGETPPVTAKIDPGTLKLVAIQRESARTLTEADLAIAVMEMALMSSKV